MTISKQIMDTWPEWWSIAKYQIPISKRFDFVVWGYAGYGQCSIPAVVLLRDLKDKEQQTHADRLLTFIKDYVTVLTESNTDTQSLQQALETRLYYATLGLSAGLGSHLGVELFRVDYEPVVSALRDRIYSIFGNDRKAQFSALHLFQPSLYRDG
jgi:hypothetical protein